MCRPHRYRSIFFVLLVFAFGTVACHRTMATLHPDKHQREVLLPQVTQKYGNPWSYEHKLRGDILLARGSIEAAADEYQKAATGDQADPWIQVQFANALLQMNDLERARYHVSKAILLDPASGPAWATAAELQLRQGNREKAFEAARYGSRLDRSDTAALRWIADQLAESTDKTEQQQALRYYQLALVRCQTDPDLFLAAGKTAMGLSYVHLAQRYLHQYLNMFGEHTDEITRIAVKLTQSGHTQAAIHLYEIMLERNPTKDTIRAQLIVLYLNSHQNDLAIGAILSFHRAPATPKRVIERSNWLQQAGAPWEARKLILENFSGAPVHPHIRYQLANIEWTLRRNEVALALLSFPGDIPNELIEKVNALRTAIKSGQQIDNNN